jgi:hypothetical protein
MDAASVDDRGGWMPFSLERRMLGSENLAAVRHPDSM